MIHALGNPKGDDKLTRFINLCKQRTDIKDKILLSKAIKALLSDLL